MIRRDEVIMMDLMNGWYLGVSEDRLACVGSRGIILTLVPDDYLALY